MLAWILISWKHGKIDFSWPLIWLSAIVGFLLMCVIHSIE